MTDYSKSSIYKIACKDASIDDIYIGSTCNLVKRRHRHKSNCNNTNAICHNSYVYRFIRDHGNWQNWDIYLIEQFNCNTKIQKEQVERGYIEQLKPTLNKCIPTNFRVEGVYNKSEYKKQYYEHNKEMVTNRSRIYYDQNKETIRKRQKHTNREPYTVPTVII